MKQVDDYMKNGIDCGCVLHGAYYTLDYAKKLEAGLRRNFSCPIRFHIWTEKAREVPKHWHKHFLKDLGVTGPKKSWWYKTQLFRNKDFQGRLFYFDLDIVVAGNLDWMLRLGNEQFWAVRDFRYLWKKNKWSINSSVMVFNTNEYSDLWKKFKRNHHAIMTQYNGDQDFVDAEVPESKKRWLNQSQVKSYRWEVMDGGMDFTYRSYPNRGKDRSHIFKDLSIIVFHGVPNPHEIDDQEVLRHWQLDK